MPLLIGIDWLRGSENTRKTMLVATAPGLLGYTLIPHISDSSFPSNHLTLWWVVVFSLML